VLHGMDDMIGEPDEMGGWPGSVTHLLHIGFPSCHTSPYVPLPRSSPLSSSSKL